VFSAGPPAGGDWIVNGIEVYSNHEVFVLNGNLIVENGGNLTLKGVTLKMNCTYDGQYSITVETGGAFYVLEGSVITSVNPSNGYCFLVLSESTFRMSDSELHECGMSFSDDIMKWGLYTLSNDTVVEKSLISDNFCGVFIAGGESAIQNNNITDNDYGVSVGNGSPTIYNNTVTSNSQFGICSGNNTVAVIRNNFVSKNGVGIGSWGVSSPTIFNNTITSNIVNGILCCRYNSPTIFNNTITSNSADGIFCNDHSNPTISDNVITSNLGTGISCTNHTNAVIQNNVITANGGGISCAEHSDATIRGNTMTSHVDAIVCYLSSPLIQGNDITGNTGTGIWCTNHSNPTIQGNMITFNDGYGIGSREGSQPEIHQNDIYGQNNYGLCNEDDSVTVNATYNYWGSESGPALGQADAVDPEEINGTVLFNPWLTESIIIAEITNPLQDETVSATVKISVNARAINGISRVEFYIDKQQKYLDSDSPYEWDWDTTQYAETSHEIMVKVIDLFHAFAAQAFRTVSVDNTAPTVSIKEPLAGNIYYGLVTVRVKAIDNREVSNVRIKHDNGTWEVMTYNSTDSLWKYELNTTTLQDGEHVLDVLALDKAGNPATTSVTMLTDNNPPTLAIQTPQSGVTVGLTLIVSVQASDVSNISRIEFYLQDVLVYTVTNMPYQWSWDTTRYPNGEYMIRVIAYDTVGHFQTRKTVVTVKNVESPWWEVHFWTIMQVLVAIGSLILAVLTYLTGKKKRKKKEKEKTE
jgi:parallel beta-helix repeat protein